jgi:hypothetical protein
LLYAHGNGIDLGWVLPLFMEFSEKTNMDILLVEYFKFGPYMNDHVSYLDWDLEILKSYEACYDYLITD